MHSFYSILLFVMAASAIPTGDLDARLLRFVTTTSGFCTIQVLSLTPPDVRRLSRIAYVVFPVPLSSQVDE